MEQKLNPYQVPGADLSLDIDDGELATRGQRFRAAMFDGLYGGVVPGVLGVVAAFAGASVSRGLMVIALVLAAAWFIGFAYLSIRSVYTNGQTLGKKRVGIKVVRTDGSRVSMARLFFLRNALPSIALGLAGGLIGTLVGKPQLSNLGGFFDLLFIVFRADRRALHDLIADTKVIIA